MNHAVAVRRIERQREVAQDALHLGRRQLVLAAHPLGQRFAVDVFHYDVNQRRAVWIALVDRNLTEAVQRNDVRMAQSRGHSRLATKSLAVLLRRRELVSQNLDGHQPVQRDIARQEHDPHSATPDLADDLELRTEMANDLLVLPVGRNRPEIAVHRHLESICVGIDEERQGAHTKPRSNLMRTALTTTETQRSSEGFACGSCVPTLCSTDVVCGKLLRLIRLLSVTCRKCPIMGRGGRW